jgi:hypothetical protein
MDLRNYVDKIFIGSINVMRTDEWHWPPAWDTQHKLRFLNDSLNYAKQNEFWEQAAIIRDVTETVKKETGSLSSDLEQ